MILYPTETIYGIGVNPFDTAAVQALFTLKGRDEQKVSAWLVRNIEDIERYAELSPTARAIAEDFLPGGLTLVLPAKDIVPKHLQSDAGTIGLRVSSDPLAQQTVEQFYAEHDAPMTCTSANVSGLKTQSDPEAIIAQFTKYRPGFSGFSEVVDGGVRSGQPSTVVHIDGSEVSILRVGMIPAEYIFNATR